MGLRKAYLGVNLVSASNTLRLVVKTSRGVWLCGICVASILVSTTPPYNGDTVGLCWGLSSQPTGVDVVANVVVQLFIDCLFNQPAWRLAAKRVFLDLLPAFIFVV